MITFTPLLSLKKLVKIFFIKSVDDYALAKPWCKKGDIVIWFSRTAWSLAAISLWWKKSFQENMPTIWVPDYFCNQSLWPVRQGEAKLIFYPVDEKLRPRWDACYRLTKEIKPDIFILVHFYGQISDVEKTKEFCDENRAIFVEDATHVMLPTGKIGLDSHFVLYSQHKFFPLSQGALCVMRPSVEMYVSLHQGNNVNFLDMQHFLGDGCYPFMKWVITQIMKKLIRNYFSRSRSVAPYQEDLPNQAMPTKPYMHSCAKKLLLLEQKKFSLYQKRRSNCVATWNHLLQSKKLNMQCIYSSNAGLIPYAAVFNCKSGNAEKIYKQLSQMKWPVSTWPDLPPEVKENPTMHTSAVYFRYNMIIFPVNQSLKITELTRKYSGDSL